MYDVKSADERVDLAGGTMRIVGWGNLHLSVYSSKGDPVEVELRTVALIPSFDKFIFIMSVARHEFTSRVTPTGTSLLNGSLFIGRMVNYMQLEQFACPLQM